MIHLDLKINSTVINEAAMEDIRMRLRGEMLAVIFKAVDAVANERGYSFNHRDVEVSGNIVLVDK